MVFVYNKDSEEHLKSLERKNMVAGEAGWRAGGWGQRGKQRGCWRDQLSDGDMIWVRGDAWQCQTEGRNCGCGLSCSHTRRQMMRLELAH